MIIVKAEAKNVGKVGICEQCGKETYIRRIEVKASSFGGAGRGWYSLCYECVSPRLFWRKSTEDLTIYESPA